MRRWIVNLGAVALFAAAAVIFVLGNFGWPNYWATVFSPEAGTGPLTYILLATAFIPFLVRAWVGRDNYNDRAGDAFLLLGINLALVAAIVWLVAALPRPVLLAIIVIATQGALTYQAWRRARTLGQR
jgi:hypothetical protein